MKRIIGHRGWASRAPENTEPGFRMALEEDRIWAIECDVHLTKDKKIVVAHDPVLGRCADATGLLAGYTYEELLNVDFGSWFGDRFKGTRIMLYSDLLKLMDGKKRLVCEIKSFKGLCDDIPRQLLRESRGYPVDKLCFKSFDHRLVRKLRDLGCRYDLGLLFADKPYRIADELKACGCNFASLLYSNCDREIFDELRRAGMDSYVWTVDTKEDYDYLNKFKNHDSAIISNKPQLFFDMVK